MSVNQTTSSMLTLTIYLLAIYLVTCQVLQTKKLTSAIFNLENDALEKGIFIVPNVVHQTYDYPNPHFFLYLSLLCVQRYIQPARHILWINDEGKYRKNQWESWQNKAKEQSWEYNLSQLIKSGRIEAKFLIFPSHPPGNDTTYVSNKAHRSDFVRMNMLQKYGGIYLDTDAFAISKMNDLRNHQFTLSFDNIVNPDKSAPKRLNNGVILSTKNSSFLKLWMKEYSKFNPASFDYDSSVVPYRLATEYPDLVHIEMSRISPISYGFETSLAADALTCGILVVASNKAFNISNSSNEKTNSYGLWYPRWNKTKKEYTFDGTHPDSYMYHALNQKLVFHLTMSAVRGICMMRKNLNDPNDLQKMPSLLGRIFRIALYGYDDFNYTPYVVGSDVDRYHAWKSCRDHLGMHLTIDSDDKSRQQYTLLS